MLELSGCRNGGHGLDLCIHVAVFAKRSAGTFPAGLCQKDCQTGPMKPSYTCSDYRQEMILAGWRKQLADPDLRPEDRKRLQEDIRRLEKEMGLE